MALTAPRTFWECLPEPEVREEIGELLSPRGTIDRDRAYSVLTEAARKTTGDEPIAALIRAPYDEEIHAGGDVLESALTRARPEQVTNLMTSLFARLAMPVYDADPRSENRLADAQNVSKMIAGLGRRFQPDAHALFQVYQSFLPVSARFWMEWLETMKAQEGLNISKEMPSWFPMHEGELAVTRQLEWTLSRPGMNVLLKGLNQSLTSNNPGDRWAAAHLIEGAVRYAREDHPPSFGGGSGPPDVVPPSVAREGFHTSDVREGGVRVGGVVPAAPVTGTPVPSGEIEPNRYTDLTLFSGHSYHGETPTDRLVDDRALVSGSKYTLEVAVRRKRTGIDAELETSREVRNPRKAKETLRVFVLAEPRDPFIEIAEPFDSIDWPYDQDSESALFRIEVKPPERGRGTTEIEVRLYDYSLDLLDIVKLKVVAVSKGEDDRIDTGEPRLTWPDEIGGGLQIAAETPPRLLSIDVVLEPASGYYKVLFKFLTANDKEIAIPGSTRIAPGDVENLLADVRDFWTELVITNYSASLNVAAATYQRYLAALRDLGVRAWLLLFGDRYAARKGASETLGELLTAMHPKEGDLIQITYSGIEDFVFPWSIVHPPIEAETVDPFEFWGARYQIEQVSEGPKDDALLDEPVSVSFALDPYFKDSELQAELFQNYAAASQGKLVVGEPVSQEQQLFAELGGSPSAHLYYFYCHGYAPAGRSLTHRDGIMLLRQKIEAIAEGTPEREALETWLGLTTKMNDEPWMYIGSSEVKESKLKMQKFFKPPRRPIVFMNMCQSAALVPSRTGGLVRVFLDHNASAVIGTESPMTGVFANAFSRVMLDELFANGNVGTALWKARRHFLAADQRNPLGLAYTLYGRAVARLGSGPVIAAGVTSNSQPNQ